MSTSFRIMLMKDNALDVLMILHRLKKARELATRLTEIVQSCSVKRPRYEPECPAVERHDRP